MIPFLKIDDKPVWEGMPKTAEMMDGVALLFNESIYLKQL